MYQPARTDGGAIRLDEFGFLGFSDEITTCEFPDVSFSSFRSMNPPFFLIRSEFDPTAGRFLKHAKDL